jgi:hypothetical protein
MTAVYGRAMSDTQAVADPTGLPKAAGLSYILPALGFGIPTPLVMAYLARNGMLPMTPFGFRAHDGPFAQAGQDVFMAAGVILIVSCTIDTVAGVLLWRGRRRGAVLGLAATPLTLAMTIGFAFPLLFVAIPIRLALTAIAWPRLR